MLLSTNLLTNNYMSNGVKFLCLTLLNFHEKIRDSKLNDGSRIKGNWDRKHTNFQSF